MPRERALLVTVSLGSRDRGAWSLEDEAAELAELAKAAACQPVGSVQTSRSHPVAGTLLGRGKLEELAGISEDLQSQVIILSQELSPAQQRNIEDILRVKTIDRTQLILDIFAQRARSKEGKIQVELAQLRYILPRLTGKGIMLSRLGGGIGTRGPGEQKLEVDRRRIRARITRLGLELARVEQRREATRSRRKEKAIPVAALIGYTNAGKTTLLNCFTGASGMVKNQLFTTLDPLARRVRLQSGEWAVITDTVGFLHHLPHHLIEAFKATLEETRDADVLLHVLDASHPMVLDRARAVEDVLEELALREKPVITILNKKDQVRDISRRVALERAYRPAVSISARTGEGLEALRQLIDKELGALLVYPTHLSIPAERSEVLAAVYRTGQVLRREDHDGVIELTVRLSDTLKARLLPYIAA